MVLGVFIRKLLRVRGGEVFAQVVALLGHHVASNLRVGVHTGKSTRELPVLAEYAVAGALLPRYHPGAEAGFVILTGEPVGPPFLENSIGSPLRGGDHAGPEPGIVVLTAELGGSSFAEDAVVGVRLLGYEAGLEGGRSALELVFALLPPRAVEHVVLGAALVADDALLGVAKGGPGVHTRVLGLPAGAEDPLVDRVAAGHHPAFANLKVTGLRAARESVLVL